MSSSCRLTIATEATRNSQIWLFALGMPDVKPTASRGRLLWHPIKKDEKLSMPCVVGHFLGVSWLHMYISEPDAYLHTTVWDLPRGKFFQPSTEAPVRAYVAPM
jgi:hypothetical protein